MHALILSALALATLPQAPRPPQAPEPPTPPAKKCKDCSVQCDCGCQSGERCRCAPGVSSEPDADGWRWVKKADGYWYKWRFAPTSVPQPNVTPSGRTVHMTAPLFRGGWGAGASCSGGG